LARPEWEASSQAVMALLSLPLTRERVDAYNG
jgi:hypothetical protein